ncbi:Ras family protein [Trichomonas vaginalis G3]|uniref:Ras family protein n=1 Tax=Trichomonas vaginalis (strain ATCC PRA-98 / G3) TaxID=412133 RepID=A2DTS3_TRIV3|nr:ribosome localization [Trichomonas vaginalis G3]EAY16220.1 Ras family protein [Trichomonas vaginalis G3]KAI5493280.1 ribosome localization [Trichomonas vaginalis G3]|eukprot:XP_001328443.1 Ras family protein [Trichomonas vaginalis G3]
MEDCVFKPKVILLGDGGVGKTKFISRINVDGMVVKKYRRLGITEYTFPVYTSIGMIEYNIWDTFGQERFGLLRDAYYLDASAVILFIDLTNRDSYVHLARWIRFVKQLCPDACVVVAATKIDAPNRILPVEKILFHQKHDYPYIEISSSTNYNIAALFEVLTRKLMGDMNIIISKPIKLCPPESDIDQEAMESCERALSLARKNSVVVPNNVQQTHRTLGPHFMNDTLEFEEDLIRDLN